MPRRAGSDGLVEQVNVRLTAQEHDVLRAVVFLRGASSAEVLREVVSEFLGRQADDRDVKAVLKTLAERRGREQGKVAPLRRRREVASDE